MPILVIVVIAVVVGFIIGLLAQRFIFSSESGDQKTAKELSALRKEYHDYQEQVSQHMQQTSGLISTIQAHYEEVQEHIFSGGQELNRTPTKQSVLQPNAHYVTYGEDEPDTKPAVETDSDNPPKDYA